MAGLFLRRGTWARAAGVAALVAAIALADRAVGNKASLGVFYIVPMVFGAMAFGPAAIVVLAVVCSSLRSVFDIPSPRIEVLLRFIFATVAYACAGLFVAIMTRNREREIAHLAVLRKEQELRREAENQLDILVESSPAAILTIDGMGSIVAANRATASLFGLAEGETAVGRPIREYLPLLADAVHYDPGPAGMRTSAECQGQRQNRDIFSAAAWFSSWNSPLGTRLAAIVVDTSEEMRDREEENLRQLAASNGIAAAAVFHEMRNLSGAVAVAAANLREKYRIGQDPDFDTLSGLVAGLENIASRRLQSRVNDSLEDVDLRSVLDDLRIVVEPCWREIGGHVRWELPDTMPRVIAERHGLMQAFLNIAHNAQRAVAESIRAALIVSVTREEQRILVRFADNGPGVASPERLFAPFQSGADGAGLGLYVSRAMLRTFGGDLRFEPAAQGACFTVELQTVS
jgi:two-component system sensor kinase FixL